MATYTDRGNGFYELNIDGHLMYYYSVGDYIECSRCIKYFRLTDKVYHRISVYVHSVKNRDKKGDFKSILSPADPRPRIFCTIAKGLPMLLDRRDIPSHKTAEFIRKLNTIINQISRREVYVEPVTLEMRIESLERENELLRKRIETICHKLNIEEEEEEINEDEVKETRVIINAKTKDDNASCSMLLCDVSNDTPIIDDSVLDFDSECIFNEVYSCSINHVKATLEQLEILGIISDRNDAGFTLLNADQKKIKATMEMFKITLSAKINT